MAVYGYARVSTKGQHLTRQITSIEKYCKEKNLQLEKVYQEKYTGTSLDRPAFNKLLKVITSGDMIIFDEVSRMSRIADEGFKLYKKLFDEGITLVFLKEHSLDTDVFKLTQQLALTGQAIADMYIETTNKVLWMLAENQIKAALEAAQHEVDFLHMRISEGQKASGATSKRDEEGNIIERGKISIGKQGKKLNVKKAAPMKADIRKYSKDFDGTLSDPDVMKLTGLARNTYYKYKREMKEEE